MHCHSQIKITSIGPDKPQDCLELLKKKLEEQTIACGAMFSVFGALKKRVQYLEPENASLNEVSHELMQKTFQPLAKPPANGSSDFLQSFSPVYLDSL